MNTFKHFLVIVGLVLAVVALCTGRDATVFLLMSVVFLMDLRFEQLESQLLKQGAGE